MNSTPSHPRNLRVMIADDHPLFRAGLRYTLERHGFTVVAEAVDGHDAVAVAAQRMPDVVLMDIKMPGCDGISACRLLSAQQHPPVVILLTTFDEPAIVQAAREAGAKGFLSKETDAETLAATIRRIVAAPEREWLPRVALPTLTARERQVLALLARGYSNKAIAKELSLSPETVKDYLEGVYRKLEVGDRLQAVNRAREIGLL